MAFFFFSCSTLDLGNGVPSRAPRHASRGDVKCEGYIRLRRHRGMNDARTSVLRIYSHARVRKIEERSGGCSLHFLLSLYGGSSFQRCREKQRLNRMRDMWGLRGVNGKDTHPTASESVPS